MHNLIEKAGECIFNSGLGDDWSEASTIALVSLTKTISDLQQFAFLNRGKRVTDKRREVANRFLSDVFFYTSALVYLNKLDSELFDLDILTEAAESFHPDYHQDAILCSNQMIGNTASLMEMMFESEDDPPEPQQQLSVLQPEGVPELVFVEGDEFMETLSLSQPEEEEEIDFDPDVETIEQMLHSIFCCALILSNKFDTDVGVIIYNASLNETFQ